MKVSTSSVRIAASPDVVWSVLTEPRHVRAWQYASDLDTDWSVGSSIRFSSQWQGQSFEQMGTVLSFDPPTRLSYWLDAPGGEGAAESDSGFTMVYELVAHDGETVLSIVQEDPRVSDDVTESEGESPVLAALKELAESL